MRNTPPTPAIAVRPDANVARLKRLGIDTYQEQVLYMSHESPVCLSEGWLAETRVQVSHNGTSVVATLNVVTNGILAPDEAGLSEAAWRRLGANEGDVVQLAHAKPVASMSVVRARAYHAHVDEAGIRAIVRDIADGRYAAIELAAFVTAFAGDDLRRDEITALARAMVDTGERLYWGRSPIVDKHCVGGLPGNRTSMIVVPIVAACGLTMPKTSSRAITSPAGTADAMATIAPVDLSLAAMRRVVEQEGACIVWGGNMGLSPADDVIISVERPLDFDSVPQLVASVLSKKVAAGSTHVVIDVPVGPTAKVRDDAAAVQMEGAFSNTAADLGIAVRVVRTDGTRPVGRGIGPALEARDVLSVLRREADAPADLRERALALAGAVLEMGGRCVAGDGMALARATLDSGAALAKLERICAAQGGMREPRVAPLTHEVLAARAGRVARFDLRHLARVAKLAGAPRAETAGLVVHVAAGDAVAQGQPLISIHAQSPGQLDYARSWLALNPQVITMVDT
jgi:thymidine phosphorylase